MPYIPLEKMLTGKKTSLYKLALAAAARANELAQGAKPLVESASKKVSSVALEEIAAGKVSYVTSPEQEKKNNE
jgi:DNA-directed RNA polymerase subunit omega